MLDFSKFDFRFLICSVLSTHEGQCISLALYGTRLCLKHTLEFEHIFERN